MNEKIITPQQAIQVAEAMKTQKKRIVLAGGCFDILHVGHIKFLEKAKAAGDVLFVLLESDEKIKEIKGPSRPLHTQDDRAYMLSSIGFIDFVVTLPYITTNNAYDEIVSQICPSVIAVTEGDTGIEHKKRQAEQIGATVSAVIKYVPNKSTSAALKAILGEN